MFCIWMLETWASYGWGHMKHTPKNLTIKANDIYSIEKTRSRSDYLGSNPNPDTCL